MQILGRVRNTSFFKSYWPERLASVLAIVGLAAAIMENFPVRTSQGSASDFKTMYGSIASMAHGLNAYDFTNIAAVFVRNGVIEPEHWFGHAPVYPPFTLALMTPLAALPMVPAIAVWFAICCAALAAALAALAQAAGEQFGLSRPWRLALIALGAGWPLCGFGLEMENVSVVAASFCVLAVVWPGGRYRWARALGLALALLLKPHLALWVVVALALLPERPTRWMAARAVALAAGIGCVLCLVMAARGDLGMQIASYLAVLHTELGAGSMSAGNHELLDVSAQILSLDSLASYFTALRSEALGLVGMVLFAGGALLTWASLQEGGSSRRRFPQVAAWCAFGMLATYHRGHDGAVLLVLLPWLLARLRDRWQDGVAWVSVVALGAMSLAPRWETYWWLETRPGMHAVAAFLLYRQAALGALVVACVLIGWVVGVSVRSRLAVMEAERMGVAAGV